MAMARYFLDLRSDGILAADEEGVELTDADAAHQAAMSVLVDAMRTLGREGAREQHFDVEVRDGFGLVFVLSAVFVSTIIRKQ